MAYLDIEPDELRRMAGQHHALAAKIRKWGEIPHTWLADFAPSYGTIADPVRAAVSDYYQDRHEKAERRALHHEQTRDLLFAAATEMEAADGSGGRLVDGAGDRMGDIPPNGSGPGSPSPLQQAIPTGPVGIGPGPRPAAHLAADRPPAVSDTMRPTAFAEPPVRSESRNGAPPVSPPAQAASSSPAAPVARMPSDAIGAVGAPTGEVVPPAGSQLPGSPPVNPPPVAAVPAAPSVVGALVPSPGIPAPSLSSTPDTAGAGAAPTMPVPLSPGPLVAVARTSGDGKEVRSLVVGERAADDMELARNLLAATLAAAPVSPRGLEWAVAVLRTPLGPLVFVTSTEGRGWLPPGVFFPAEVALPWKWDAALGSAAGKATSAVEGTADPARMLVEFGLIARRRGARISAVASSAPIPDYLGAALGDEVLLEGRVSATDSVIDLLEPGAGLVDRLTLAGSHALLERAETVPDSQVRAACLELAWMADAQVRAAAALSGIGTSETGRIRREIIGAFRGGRPVPTSLWDALRVADERSAASLSSARTHIVHVPVGRARAPGVGAEAMRCAVFERRADEILRSLAAGPPDRQTLRDTLYAYGQIVEHPQFPAAARAAISEAAAPGGVAARIPDAVAGAIADGVAAGSARYERGRSRPEEPDVHYPIAADRVVVGETGPGGFLGEQRRS